MKWVKKREAQVEVTKRDDKDVKSAMRVEAFAPIRDLKKASARVARDNEELDCGFSIGAGEEDVIERNFEERFGRYPTSDDWDQLNKDILTVERNGLKYLKKVLDFARGEGHDSTDDLVGSCSVKWSNKKGLETIYEHSEDAMYPHELSRDEESVMIRGVSKLGISALDVRLYFYDIDIDDAERLDEEVG